MWAIGTEPPDPFERARQRLDRRVEEYLALRRAKDWAALYLLSDPADRHEVGMAGFLAAYSRDYLDIHEMRATSIEIDPITRRARVGLWFDVELVPERLPERFRQGVRGPPPEFLRTQDEHSMSWTWVDDQWFFEMDDFVVERALAQARENAAEEEE